MDVHLPLPEAVALALAACFFLDVAIFLVAQIYSRFVFDRYLKKNHRQKWEELVHGSDNWGPNLGGFDRTRQMHKFRTQSKEDLGDPNIRKLVLLADGTRTIDDLAAALGDRTSVERALIGAARMGFLVR